MDELRYVLEMSAEQAKMTSKALELYARLRIGQWRELDYLCLDLSDDDYCEKRDELVSRLLAARAVAYPELGRSEGRSYGIGMFPDADLAWELHEVLRHRIAWTEHPEGGITVNFDRPISLRGNELAKCEAKGQQ